VALELKGGKIMNTIEYLNAKKIKFREIKLSGVPRTAKDVVKIYGCPLEQVLKTLVFVGKTVIIIVLQGDKKVNMEKVRSITKDKKIRMSTPNEIVKLFNKNIGSLDPFIKCENCIKILDKKIFSIDKVNMGSGIPGIGIEMATEEFRKAWDGVIDDIT